MFDKKIEKLNYNFPFLKANEYILSNIRITHTFYTYTFTPNRKEKKNIQHLYSLCSHTLRYIILFKCLNEYSPSHLEENLFVLIT